MNLSILIVILALTGAIAAPLRVALKKTKTSAQNLGGSSRPYLNGLNDGDLVPLNNFMDAQARSLRGEVAMRVSNLRSHATFTA